MADEVEAFPALRPHQRHAWHAFLVQLGAMAMHQDRLDTPPSYADEWLRIIRSLTPGCRTTNRGNWWWTTSPNRLHAASGQFQEREKDFKNTVATPDDLDMLVTSKNHDLKSEVAEQAGKDDWIFALATLQTTEGFGGAENYGISRMNGGLGNRSAFALAPAGLSPGAHVRRDIEALLEFLPG